MTPIQFSERKIRSLQTLSERLQAARKLRGLSLADVASETGVQERYLQAIEENRFDELPAAVYSRGFVTRYAEEMNLPSEEIMAMYDHERGIDTHLRHARGERSPAETRPIQAKKTKFFFSPKMIRIGIAVVAVSALVVYLIVQFRALSAAPTLVVTDPEGDVTVDASSYTVVGTVEQGSRVLLNGSEVRVSANGTFEEEVPLEPGQNSLRFVATNAVEKTTVLERMIIVPEPLPEPEPKKKKSKPVEDETPSDDVSETDAAPAEESVAAGPITFGLSVEEDTWIEVSADDQQAFAGVLAAGEERVFEAQERILLSSGKGFLTHGTLNGEDLGRLGAKGEVLTGAIVTSEGITK